ncbi:MAG: ATP-binding protein [Promethearchaeota archaeon]
MSDAVYQKLRDFLDQFPIGFPKTESGVEIEILKRLYNEEEAKIAVYLTITPEKISKIARRSNFDQKYLEEKLELMSKKGLIFRTQREGSLYYNAIPFMIGLYEYSVKTMDKELASLYKKYYESAFLDELGSSNVPGFKVIPIEETIEPKTVLLPYQLLKESIKKARVISLTECICRKEARLVGEGCNYPIETCLSFGVAAEYYIENGIGREISAEEAIRVVEEADKAGLIHASANSKHLSNICNCCPCCCASMKGITKLGHNKHKYLNAIFESIIDENLCVACGVCIERCPVKAISLNHYAIVDRDLCIGCGLCASNCSEGAITLKVREDGEEPFNRILEMGMAIIEGKRKHN